MKICCFAGHNEIYDDKIKEKLNKQIINLIETQNVKTFWVGNYGKFDIVSANAVRDIQKIYTDVKLELIIPYLTREINEYKEIYYKNYNNILIAYIPVNTPKRIQIIKTNQYMIDNCDYLICYLQRSWGGAFNTVEYAKTQPHIKIFNICATF